MNKETSTAAQDNRTKSNYEVQNNTIGRQVVQKPDIQEWYDVRQHLHRPTKKVGSAQSQHHAYTTVSKLTASYFC